MSNKAANRRILIIKLQAPQFETIKIQLRSDESVSGGKMIQRSIRSMASSTQNSDCGVHQRVLVDECTQMKQSAYYQQTPNDNNMNKSGASSKYLQAFDPFAQDPSVNSSHSEQQSCVYLHNIQTVRETILDPGKENISLKFQSSKHSEHLSVKSGQSKRRQTIKSEKQNRQVLQSREQRREVMDYERQIQTLQGKIQTLTLESKQKDNKLLLLTQHLETLEFHLEITKSKHFPSPNETFSQLISSALKKQLTNKQAHHPQYTQFLTDLTSLTKQPSQLLSKIFSTLRQSFSNPNQPQLVDLKHRYQQVLKLNSKLFQQHHQLKQQLQKQQIETTLQINSLINIQYQSLSLLKQFQNTSLSLRLREYIQVFQRMIDLSKTVISLNKNIKQFKESSVKRGIHEDNQEWYFQEILFKKNLVEQEKKECQALNNQLVDIYHEIQADFVVQKIVCSQGVEEGPRERQEGQRDMGYQRQRQIPTQQIVSPLRTFKNSASISKKCSLTLTRRDQPCGTQTMRTSRNRVFQEVTNKKSEVSLDDIQKEMQHQKSLKQLKTKLEMSAARSRKSTLWG